MKLKLLLSILLFSSITLQNLFCQCVASFSFTGNPCKNDSLQFTFTGTGDSLQWNFDDIPSGYLNESNLNTVWHKFSTDGNYNIQLIVSDTSGCSDTIIQTIIIFNNPTVNYVVENTCTNSLTSFLNQSTADIGDSIIGFYYTFGDGNFSNFKNPTHNYASVGTKNTKLKITTKKGCKDSLNKNINIFTQPYIVKAIDSICQGIDLNLDVNHGSDIVNTYLWNLGDASSNSNKFFIHQYNSPGVKKITLKLTYANGSYCFVQPDSTLVFKKPNSFFTINTTLKQCYKQNLSCITFGTDTTGISFRNILWDDGSSNTVEANLLNTCYTYTNKNGGKYRITNEVIDSNGCANRYTTFDTITVHKDPKADFTILKTGGCFKTYANVTNISNMTPPKIKKFAWNWGDGTTDDSTNWANTQHTYTANGNFKIRLSILDTFNCYDTLLSSGTINNTSYIVDARLDDVIDSCRTTNLFNYKQTPINGATIKWYWGDGDSNVLNNWNLNYSYHKGRRYGTYQTFVKISKNGCDSNLFLKKAIVYGPYAQSQISNRFQCQIQDTVKFLNTTLTYKNNALKIRWHAGDPFAPNCSLDSFNNYPLDSNCNNGKDSLRFQHFYTPGKENCYYLRITATDSILGCTDSNLESIPLDKPDASDGINFVRRFSNNLCLGPEDYKLVEVNLNQSNRSCNREDYWIMWDSLCAEKSGNFNANWENRNRFHTYNYVPCDSTGKVTIGVIIQNGRDTLGNVCRDTAFYHHVINFGVIDPRFTTTYNPLLNYCKNSSFEFTLKDSTLDSIVNIVWNYGDGTIENNLFLGKRYHKYKNRGIYNVSVTLTHNNGCTATESYIIRIGAEPKFILTKNKLCVGDTAFITNNTNYWYGPNYWNNAPRQALGLETTRWDIGNGNGFTLTDATIPLIYNKIGNYNVRFEYTDSTGCVDTFNLPAPVRVFNVFSDITLPPSNLICAQVVQFKSSATVYDSLNNFGHPDDSLVEFSWYYDNATSNSVLKNPFKFFKAGWHNVKLIAKNTIGCKDEYTDSIFIKGPLAKYSVITDTIGCMPLIVTFKNNSVSANSYTWLYRNAANNTFVTTSAANVSFAYTAYGAFRPQLIARNTFNNNGINVTCADTMVPNINLAYSPRILVYEKPRPNFTHATNCANYTTQFTNTSALTTAAISRYEWYFGDGDSSQARHPLHQFADSGRYRIVMKAFSPNGCVDSVVRNIFVYPFPAANFTFNDVCIGKVTNFRDISLRFNDVLTAWNWNFGNGISTNVRNPNYIYPKDSVSYNVRLIVTNRSGCSNTIFKQVKVYANPKPNFIPTNVCLKSPTLFSNIGSSKQGIAFNSWTLGNGATKVSSYFNYVYADTGIYQVKLKATSIWGCQDSISKQVRIYSNPKSNFTINNTSQCVNQNKFIFTNTSAINIGSISNTIWQLSDSYGANSTHLTYKFRDVGNLSIRLISRSNNNCYDTILKYVIVKPSPKAIIQIDNYEKCEEADSFLFTDKSTIDTSIATRNWKFTNSNFSNLKITKFKFPIAGNYPIRLIVSNTSACADTVNTFVLVHPKPRTYIKQFAMEQCLKGNSFRFADSTIIANGYFLSYKWKFGNGDTSNFSDLLYNYKTSDTFKVKLTITTNKFCKDTAYTNVVVHPMPAANFTIDTNKQCYKNNLFTFTNNSTIIKSTLTYKWRFGDGTSSILKNTSKSFANYGNYSTWLKATTPFGCADSTSKTINVYAMPLANFKLTDTAVCFRNNRVVAINTSSIAQGSYTNYWFTLPKNQVGNDTFRVSYLQDSVFRIKLKTVSNFGCMDSITKNTYVYPMPNTKFKVDSAAQCLRGNKFSFTNTSSAKDGITYSWNFGNGISSKVKDTAITYTNFGTFKVLLISNSIQGCKDSQIINLTIHPMPKAIVGVNDSLQCFNTQNFVFTDKSKIANGSLKRQWQWYDNSTDTNKITSKYLVKDSTYKSKLISTSLKQCADTFVFNTTAHSVPKAVFNINDSDQCLPIQNFIYTNASAIKKGTNIYNWQMGDGYTSNAVSAQYKYNASTNYNVQLKAISNFGCRDSITKQVIVFHQPKAKLSLVDSAQCLRFNLFKLIGNSSLAQGSIMGYNWDTSNINFSGLQNANFSYKTFGTKTIRYIVESNNNCFDTTYQTLTIHPMPKANFSINNPIQCVQKNNFIFTQTSNIAYGSMNHYWQIDNGAKDSGKSINRTFNQSDTPSVKLVSISNKNCTDTALRNIYVQPTPKAAFSINDSGQCLKINQFAFTNTSQVGHGSFKNYWQFADGNFDTTKNTTHKYLQHGDYNVKLIVETNYNCTDSTTVKLLVHPEPKAYFAVNDSSQCYNGNAYNFTNLSTIDSTTLSYNWKLGDSTISTLKDISKTYTNTGFYTINLKTTSQYNCIDSFKKPIQVNHMPIAKFSINNSGQCLKINDFKFINNSTIPLGSLSYAWQMGDITTDTNTNTTHTYSKHGNYNVALKAISNLGCTDSTQIAILVHPEPIANFTVNDFSQCQRYNLFETTNLSSIDSTSLSYSWQMGDGKKSTQVSPQNKYANYGNYTIGLVVKSNYNCTDSIKHQVVVNPMPKAKFTINDSTQCINNQLFNFTDKSALVKGTILNYQWQIADRNFNTQNVSQLKLPNSGIKKVQLVATTDSLCTDTANSQIRVYAKPVANFTINDSVQCLTGNKFIFTSTSTDSIGINNYQWQVNNISESPSPVFTKSFTQTAKYNIHLMLNSTVGCKDTIMQTIRVKLMPDPAFNKLKPYYCNSEPPFMLVPVTAGGTFSGKNVVGNMLLPNQLFKDTVRYTVTVEGCTTSSQQTTDIYPFPHIDMGADSTLCKNESMVLKATNWNSTYKWHDGSTDAEYLALKAGKYWVTATNLCGSYSDSITIQFRDKNCRLWLPTAFSPNRDGKNEIYKPITYGVTEMTYEIFNRWGEKVFIGDLNSPGWDATYKGEPVYESYFLIIVNYSFVNSGKKFNFTEKEVFYLLK